MPASPPIITLLTDFGLRDAYVGIMQGVILGRCPEARIIDLTHGVEQGNIHAAGYLLSAAWPYFPAGTVHTVVVDPGVGSGRRILAARIAGQYFIAPDNGLLSMLTCDRDAERMVSVENDSLFVKPVSNTFHGRDIFAPTAAALTSGVSIDELGPTVDSWIRLPGIEPQREPDGALVGEVVYVDRFGNLISNIPGEAVGRQSRISIAGRCIEGLSRAYTDVPEGDLLAITGSTDRLEISISQGDAAQSLGVTAGEPVRVREPSRETAS